MSVPSFRISRGFLSAVQPSLRSGCWGSRANPASGGRCHGAEGEGKTEAQTRAGARHAAHALKDRPSIIETEGKRR
jgi:hypothetical protein